MGHKARPAAARLPVTENDRPGAASGQRPGVHAAPARERAAPGALALRNWPVAGRLFAVIVLAAAMGLVFGGLQVSTAVAQASQYAQVTKVALLGQQGIVLAQALEEERAETAMYLAAKNGSGQKLPAELAKWYGPLGQDGLNDPTKGITGVAADKFQSLMAAIGDSYPAGTRNDVTAVEDLVIADLAGFRGGVASTG